MPVSQGRPRKRLVTSNETLPLLLENQEVGAPGFLTSSKELSTVLFRDGQSRAAGKSPRWSKEGPAHLGGIQEPACMVRFFY